jgi:hypothetical protein
MDGWRVCFIMDRELVFDHAHIRLSHGGYELLCITLILGSRVGDDYSAPARFSKNVRRIIILKYPGP